MNSQVTVETDSEFFIAIAKFKYHSFLMLGVMIEEQPILLAQVGKSLIDKRIDHQRFPPIINCVII